MNNNSSATLDARTRRGVNVQITLKNESDKTRVKDGSIAESAIRQVTVDALVDTGSTMLVINQEIFEKLGLTVIGERPIGFVDNSRTMGKITDAVEIIWGNRSFIMSTLLIEDADEILLGVLPLEGMDLIVDTVNQKLVGAHGDQMRYLCY